MWKYILYLLIFNINFNTFSQDLFDDIDEYNYDFEMPEGITIFGERLIIETFVLNQLNGSSSDRKRFIEKEFLENTGFRRTGNVRYRRTDASERVFSVLHGFAHLLSFGIVPRQPFSEIEYDRLPKGQYYSFESVFVRSRFNNVSQYIQIIMKLEYMLQIEFCNGIVIQDTLNYYTDENINKFEELIHSLPDYPENINEIKNRFIIELVRIKSALERHRNPSENQLRAMENLRGGFNIN